MYYFCLADLLGSLGNIVKMNVDEPLLLIKEIDWTTSSDRPSLAERLSFCEM